MPAPKGSTPWNALDLSGRQFGRLTVLRLLDSKDGRRRWLCRCSCGGQAVPCSSHLLNGNSTSCGCVRRERIRELNLGTYKYALPAREFPEYHAWRAMRARCCNPNDAVYANYGGRGIRVCDRWDESFEAFWEDMGPRPSINHSLDRADNNSDYAPGNCRWTTAKQQTRNRRGNRLVAFDGLTLTLAEWSERTGLNRSTISERLERGWSVVDTLTVPLADCGKLEDGLRIADRMLNTNTAT